MAYNNYNAKSSIFIKQFFNRMGKVQSSMFTLVYPLRFVKDPNHLLLAPTLKHFKTSRDTQVTLLNILMKYVEGFSYLKDSSAIQYKARCQLASTPKTEFYPMCMATIEEAMIKGNLHIHEDAYIDQMRCNPDSLGTMVIPLCRLEHLGDMTAWLCCDPFQTYVGIFSHGYELQVGIWHKHYGAAKQLGSLSHHIQQEDAGTPKWTDCHQQIEKKVSGACSNHGLAEFLFALSRPYRVHITGA
ncbi:hypothetical protein ARMGADRAFT_1032193 [Armillaria gallica]|uniref:DUF6589 domain-containing protein n=1 Tax=Armillaria gallica TaxID=47427 RepID=A0A2H3D5X5_ARMGA|nr:hypothetical protein ARMGADRAFT_1032193 [Armillaria gallica]